MGQTVDNFKRGTAEMLVLYLLSKEDLYGYQITQAFAEKSDGVYTMLEGSLYPILYRLTEAGYITDYTQLEDAGRAYYKEILADYDSVTGSINKILDRIEGDNI